MNAVDQYDDEGIDLLKLLRDLRRGWRLIAVASFVGVIVAVVMIKVTPKEYEAPTTLSPVAAEAGSGFVGGSSALSSLGGLASLAGFSTQANSMRADTLATLQSGALAEEFIRQNDLVPILLGNRALKPSEGLSPEEEKARRLRIATALFDAKVRKVDEEIRTGIVTLTIRWKGRQEAARWANDYVRLANSYLRERAVAASERNISYLNEQLAKTNVVELRSAIYTLMEAEIKKQMLARGADDYALKVIDPATLPEDPVFPRPVLWVVLGFIAGGFISCLYVLIRSQRRSQ